MRLIKGIIFILVIFIILYIFLSVNPIVNNKEKDKLMNYFYNDSISYITVNKNNYKEILKHLKYPLVFKPCFCSSFGNQVKLVNNNKEASKYMSNNINETVMVQELHKGPYEGTILFEKNPLTDNVKIIFVERVNPDKNKKKIWFWKSSDSYNYGYYTIHRPEFETKELKDYITKICAKIPKFYIGRFDIRFKNYNDVKKGKNIGIVELNDILCSDTRFNDKKSCAYNTYIFLRWIIIRLYYGSCNIVKGEGVSLNEYINWIKNNQFTKNCYPKSKYINFLNKVKRSYIG